MLIDLWEKLRGYDRWIETEATVERSDVTDRYDPKFPVRYRDISKELSSRDVLKFTDEKGETQRLSFSVPGDSPLFLLVDGSKVKIRYNPLNSDQYYLRELLQTRLYAVVKRISVPLLVLIALILYWWFRL